MCPGKTPRQRGQTLLFAWGKLCGVPETNPLGLGIEAAWCWGIFSPHRPQNFEFAGSCDLHLGQGMELGRAPSDTIVKLRFPHRPQNFTPSAKRELQFVQATIPGITLDCPPLIPRDSPVRTAAAAPGTPVAQPASGPRR